ncbi:hypothetical protein IT575_13635 [bacterium]|nr:hypothetical protein [bacterium]
MCWLLYAFTAYNSGPPKLGPAALNWFLISLVLVLMNTFSLHSSILPVRQLMLGLCFATGAFSGFLLLPDNPLAAMRRAIELDSILGTVYLSFSCVCWLASAWLQWIDLQLLRSDAIEETTD